MPISISEFDAKARPVEERIVEFLDKNPRQAYSLSEVVATLEGYESIGGFVLAITMQGDEKKRRLLGPYAVAFKTLLEGGRIRRGVHQGQEYFASVKGK